MSAPKRPDDIRDCARRLEPEMNALGMQFLRIDSNTGHALFSDKADPCPIIIEYRLSDHWTHTFRVTVRGLVMGITMETPWVWWGKDTFDPRLKRMRHYADALRKSPVFAGLTVADVEAAFDDYRCSDAAPGVVGTHGLIEVLKETLDKRNNT